MSLSQPDLKTAVLTQIYTVHPTFLTFWQSRVYAKLNIILKLICYSAWATLALLKHRQYCPAG